MVLAALGWVALNSSAGSENQHKNPPNKETYYHQSAASAPIAKPSSRPDAQQPAQVQCVNSDSLRQDCTRASAQATIDQAGYARWQTIAAIAGVFVGAATLVAAFLAAKWAKAAAKETAIGAKAALDAVAASQESNRITDDASKRQLRAYVGGSNFRVEMFFAESRPATTWTLKNYGSSIARDVQVIAGIFIVCADHQYIRFRHSFILKRDLLPGEEWPYRYPWPLVPSDKNIEDFLIDKISFVYAGVIRYRDAYGIRRYTTFKKAVGTQNLNVDTGDGPMLNCVRGNKSN